MEIKQNTNKLQNLNSNYRNNAILLFCNFKVNTRIPKGLYTSICCNIYGYYRSKTY